MLRQRGARRRLHLELQNTISPPLPHCHGPWERAVSLHHPVMDLPTVLDPPNLDLISEFSQTCTTCTQHPSPPLHKRKPKIFFAQRVYFCARIPAFAPVLDNPMLPPAPRSLHSGGIAQQEPQGWLWSWHGSLPRHHKVTSGDIFPKNLACPDKSQLKSCLYRL